MGNRLATRTTALIGFQWLGARATPIAVLSLLFTYLFYACGIMAPYGLKSKAFNTEARSGGGKKEEKKQKQKQKQRKNNTQGQIHL